MAEGMDAAAILDEIEALAATRRVRVELRVAVGASTRWPGPRPPRGWWPWPGRSRRPRSSRCASRAVGAGCPFLLVLDGITDPHNLGALLRSAECAGVTGVVLPRHRSAHLSPTVAKVAAGAIEYLPMALVAGVPAALAAAVGPGGVDGGPGRGRPPVALRADRWVISRWRWSSGRRARAWPP